MIMNSYKKLLAATVVAFAPAASALAQSVTKPSFSFNVPAAFQGGNHSANLGVVVNTVGVDAAAGQAGASDSNAIFANFGATTGITSLAAGNFATNPSKPTSAASLIPTVVQTGKYNNNQFSEKNTVGASNGGAGQLFVAGSNAIAVTCTSCSIQSVSLGNFSASAPAPGN